MNSIERIEALLKAAGKELELLKAGQAPQKPSRSKEYTPERAQKRHQRLMKTAVQNTTK
jgi:hypothetical protein